MEQVFSNLIGNAAKYLGDTADPRIEIGAIERDGAVEYYVRDNGIGIAPEYHARVFETFQRLKDVEVEGTGIGLAIVKKVIDAAGGDLRVESAVGEGLDLLLYVASSANDRMIRSGRTTAGGKARPRPIDPDALHPEPCAPATSKSRWSPTMHVSAGCAPSVFERVAVNGLVRLAGPELALDHDDVEVVRERVARDLVALLARVPVRDEPEAYAARTPPGETRERVGKQAHLGAAARREFARDPAASAGSGHPTSPAPGPRSSSTRPACSRARADAETDRPRTCVGSRRRRQPASRDRACCRRTRPYTRHSSTRRRHLSSRAACRRDRATASSRLDCNVSARRARVRTGGMRVATGHCADLFRSGGYTAMADRYSEERRQRRTIRATASATGGTEGAAIGHSSSVSSTSSGRGSGTRARSAAGWRMSGMTCATTPRDATGTSVTGATAAATGADASETGAHVAAAAIGRREPDDRAWSRQGGDVEGRGPDYGAWGREPDWDAPAAMERHPGLRA